MKAVICNDENRYMRDSICQGVRLDSRKVDERRVLEVLPQKMEQYDNSVHMRRGATEVEVSLRFEENDIFLRDLNLLTDEEFSAGSARGPCVKCNIEPPFDIAVLLGNFFDRFKMSINIEVRVIRDDGSVFTLLFDALGAVFSRISVPVFSNMQEYTEDVFTLRLPTCDTFALINGKAVLDPTLLEETACDGIFHVLKSDAQTLGISMTDAINIHIDDVTNFVSQHG